MIRFRILFGILLLVLLPSVAYCSGENDLSGLQFMKRIEQQGETKGDPLLVFSNVQISGSHWGNIYVFQGKIKINGTVNGNIYVCGGEIYIGENGIIKGNVKTLSATVSYHQSSQIDGAIEPMIATLDIFKRQWDETLFSYYTDDVPIVIIKMAKIVLQIIISLLFLSLFKKTVILEGISLTKQGKGVAYRGLMIYLMGIALMLIFALSVVGFPFALLLLLCSWLVSGLGEAALSLIIGGWVEERIYGQKDIYIEFWIGISIIQLLNNIPLLGELTTVFLTPILSIGMFSQVIINRLLKNSYIHIEEEQGNTLSPYYQEKLYETITRDIKRRGEK